MSDIEGHMRLMNFRWKGDEFKLSPTLIIRRLKQPPDLSTFSANLSPWEIQRSAEVTHWLCFTGKDGDQSAIRASGEILLFCLWLVKPTKTHIDIWFWANKAEERSGSSRLLDRFSWISETTAEDYSTEELECVGKLFKCLSTIYQRKGRLNDAMLIAISGCWSHYWQAALICSAAAVEALITYSAAPGITRRLAITFACITEAGREGRDAAFREFCEVYSARSDAMAWQSVPIGPIGTTATLRSVPDGLKGANASYLPGWRTRGRSGSR